MRNAHIARFPFCAECERRGRVTLGREVDHIVPHKNDADLFWRGELQTLCSPCHAAKTIRENGGRGRAAILPKWIDATRKTLIVVCGPPGAGKTTYVAERAGISDLVLDLDALAVEVAGIPLHEMDDAGRDQIIRERNRRLSAFTEGRLRHPRCWLIATAGTFKQRKFWADKGAEVVVIDTPKPECKWRIQQDPKRPEHVKQGQCRAVDAWN